MPRQGSCGNESHLHANNIRGKHKDQQVAYTCDDQKSSGNRGIEEEVAVISHGEAPHAEIGPQNKHDHKGMEDLLESQFQDDELLLVLLVHTETNGIHPDKGGSPEVGEEEGKADEKEQPGGGKVGHPSLKQRPRVIHLAIKVGVLRETQQSGLNHRHARQRDNEDGPARCFVRQKEWELEARGLELRDGPNYESMTRHY